jgi:archaeosine synthase beta-subunit
MLKDIAPIYHGKRTFLGLKDLVVSFYTEKCQFSCSFCDLSSRSSEESVSEEDVIKQIHWVFDQYVDEIQQFQQLSAGNEGSILDRNRFFEGAMEYLLERAKEMSKLQVLSLETRPEYIRAQVLEDILRKTNANQVDVTVGFETQDDVLRNEVLNKRMNRNHFERKVEILGDLGVRLTSYVMLKPGPYMSEEEGVTEAVKTIEYLHELCAHHNTNLVIYLNPTYVANKSSLAQTMKKAGYKPPKIQSVLKTILSTQPLGIPIYTGLWCENLADETGEFSGRDDYDKRFRNAIKQFNKTQDSSVIKQYQDLLRE